MSIAIMGKTKRGGKIESIEKRNHERFEVRLSSRLFVVEPSGDSNLPEFLKLSTKNISQGGAFFEAASPLPIGTYLDIDITLASKHLKNSSRIRTRGRILRIETAGMAVRFDKQYQIRPV